MLDLGDAGFLSASGWNTTKFSSPSSSSDQIGSKTILSPLLEDSAIEFRRVSMINLLSLFSGFSGSWPTGWTW